MVQSRGIAEQVKVTGLGLPSEMRDFIKDGTVTAFQLWSPYNEGWLAAHFAKGVIEGTIKNEVGSTFEVPNLGTITINANNSINTQAELTTFNADNIDDFKGLNKRSPWYALMMLFVMFSMAGVPFFIGFFAKLSVLQAVVAAGYFWLAVLAVVMSVIGAFYYLRVVKLMYFDEPVDASPIHAPAEVRVMLSANGLAIAALGLAPQMLMSVCAYALLGSL